ncbi:hypothetical protein HYE67_004721 [Fusarium culmorum]|uniref:Uncharacterized protein n=1 Tax=Fusarium culmorum TaxID=5516 RepID=A0A2T4GZR6_FUSCU|nr:hypothetical protein FCULG_00010785 [Fusarium culmorum]QPC62490.1 hypothetical protein HYE67_004721 [Fusarium culmorum]
MSPLPSKNEWADQAKARIMSSEAKSGNDPEFAKLAQSETDKTLAKKESEAEQAQVDNASTDKGKADNAQTDESQADNAQGATDQGEQKK